MSAPRSFPWAFLVLVALLAGAAWLFHRHAIETARTEVAEAKAEAEFERREHVPRAEFTAARKAAADNADRAESLEHQLAEAKSLLAASRTELTEAEQKLAALTTSTPATATTGTEAGPVAVAATPKPDLAKGSFSLRDDFRIYSPDAQLKIGNNVTISSPVGMMLSDADLSTVAGDLAVETPSGKVEAMHAFVDIVDGKIEMTADSMRFTNK
ncbi:MAG TPA: hypothetical protein VHD32_11620 [Candidatus Didemnitutus sp.]|nr:hypothetical protein [Candidatus Didemnitutus sp.]